jgi:hypothetical protein
MSISSWISRDGFMGGSPFLVSDNAQIRSEDQAWDTEITSFAPDDFNQHALIANDAHWKF